MPWYTGAKWQQNSPSYVFMKCSPGLSPGDLSSLKICDGLKIAIVQDVPLGTVKTRLFSPRSSGESKNKNPIGETK